MTHEEEMKRAFFGRGAEHDVNPVRPKAKAPIPVSDKLIAAAPDLLEALTNLVGLARLGAAHLDKYPAALAVADAAIKKATA